MLAAFQIQCHCLHWQRLVCTQLSATFLSNTNTLRKSTTNEHSAYTSIFPDSAPCLYVGGITQLGYKGNLQPTNDDETRGTLAFC